VSRARSWRAVDARQWRVASYRAGCVDGFQRTLAPPSRLKDMIVHGLKKQGVRIGSDLRKNLRVIRSRVAHGYISLLELRGLSLNELERAVEQAVAI
jgi:hypothetical protein